MAGRPRPGSWSTSGTSTAILPSDGTLILDRTYVELPGLSNPLREAARDVRDFLLDPAQQDRFADVGFRDDHDEASDGLVRTLHLNSGQPPGRLGRPTADVIAAIRTGWRQLSKRANLRVVVDESGDGAAQRHRRPGRSYGGREGRAAGRDGRPQPGGHDWLLGFASDPAGPHRQLLPISAYGDGATFTRAVGALRIASKPHDNTPLCDTIRDAHEYLRTHLDQRRINAVVVLTDGRHDYPEDPARVRWARSAISGPPRTRTTW